MVAIAGLGGLLYGYDLGIISTALLYLGKCVELSEAQIGLLASAVMVGALASSLVGGGCSDLMGRKKTLIFSALLFIVSVVLIVTAHGFWPLFFGRTLQGLSAGMISVVVPVFMSESVPARIRGTGSTLFQLSLTLGILFAMAAGAFYQAGVSRAVAAATGDAARILVAEDRAWRNMFWSSIWPALLFFAVTIFASESPRWLFQHGRQEEAFAVLLRGRDRAQAELEMAEMTTMDQSSKRSPSGPSPDSLLRRHYLVPLALAVALLGLNQSTGIVAVFTFPVVMLHQSGLSEAAASTTGVWLALTNFLVTIFGVLLIDKLGSKTLLKIGTGTIILALMVGVFTFRQAEAGREDVSSQLRSAIAGSNTLDLALKQIAPSDSSGEQVQVVYTYDHVEKTALVRTLDADPVLRLHPDAKSPQAQLKILRAELNAIPSEATGHIVFACLLVYIIGFAFGPGVCLWVLSSELLPTRIRSFGMGVGVLFNAVVSIASTASFLPIVGRFGYAAMWGIWLGFTVLYFLFTVFLLPETRNKTLEEIEAGFVRESST